MRYCCMFEIMTIHMHKLVKISGIVNRQPWNRLNSYAAHSVFWARRKQDGVQIMRWRYSVYPGTLGPTMCYIDWYWAYSTGQVLSHTFLLIGRFYQFCIRLVPEMKPCEIHKNGWWTQRYGVSNVSMEELSRDLAATVLLKLTISSDSYQLGPYGVWNCSILNYR